MSVQATTWAWTHSQATGTALLVLLAVADAANAEGGRSFQSVPTIARMVRASERTVQRALRDLEASGELAKEGKGPHGSTSYRFPGMAPQTVDKTVDNHTQETLEGVTPVTGGVTPGVSRGDIAVSPNPNNPITPYGSNPDDTAAPRPSGATFPEDAKEVVNWWWDSLDIKPAGRGAWPSAVKTVASLLKVGHTKKDVAKALQRTGAPVSIARMEIALSQITSKSTVRDANTDHWAQGGQFMPPQAR